MATNPPLRVVRSAPLVPPIPSPPTDPVASPPALVSGPARMVAGLWAPVPVRSPMPSGDQLWRAKRMAKYSPLDRDWQETMLVYRQLNILSAQSTYYSKREATPPAEERLGRAHRFVEALRRAGVHSGDLLEYLDASYTIIAHWKNGVYLVPSRILECVSQATCREHARYLFCELVAADVAEYCARHPHVRGALALRALLNEAGKKASECGIGKDHLTGVSPADTLLAVMRGNPPDQWRQAIAALRQGARLPHPYRDEPLNTGLREAVSRLGVSGSEMARRLGQHVMRFHEWCRGDRPVPERMRDVATAIGAARDQEDLTRRLRAVGPVPPAARPAAPRPLTEEGQAQFQRLNEAHRSMVVAQIRSRLAAAGLNSDALVEDLTQETWLALAKAICRGNFREGNSGGWLYCVAAARVADHLRKVCGNYRHHQQMCTIERQLGHPPTVEDLVTRYKMTPDDARAWLERSHAPRRSVPLPEER